MGTADKEDLPSEPDDQRPTDDFDNSSTQGSGRARKSAIVVAAGAAVLALAACSSNGGPSKPIMTLSPSSSASASPRPSPDSSSSIVVGSTAHGTKSPSPSIITSTASSADQVIDSPQDYFAPRTEEAIEISPNVATTIGAQEPITVYFREADGHTGHVTGDLGSIFSGDIKLPNGGYANLPFIISETNPDGSIDKNSVLGAVGVDRDLKDSVSFGMLTQIVKITSTVPADIEQLLIQKGDIGGFILDAIAVDV